MIAQRKYIVKQAILVSLMTYILSNGGNISLIKYQACLEFGDEFYR
jgi:hypothetical protein